MESVFAWSASSDSVPLPPSMPVLLLARLIHDIPDPLFTPPSMLPEDPAAPPPPPHKLIPLSLPASSPTGPLAPAIRAAIQHATGIPAPRQVLLFLGSPVEEGSSAEKELREAIWEMPGGLPPVVMVFTVSRDSAAPFSARGDDSSVTSLVGGLDPSVHSRLFSLLSSPSLPHYRQNVIVSPENLERLVEMGFPQAQAMKALLLNRWNLQQAMDWLLAHADDPHFSDPLSDRQLSQVFLSLGRTSSPQDVSQDVRRCIESRRCTFHATGPNYEAQPYHQCFTCNLVDGRGCCASCVETCHRGHRVSLPLFSDSFYCDCGANSACRTYPVVQDVRQSSSDQLNPAEEVKLDLTSSRRLPPEYVPTLDSLFIDPSMVNSILSPQQQLLLSEFLEFLRHPDDIDAQHSISRDHTSVFDVLLSYSALDGRNVLCVLMAFLYTKIGLLHFTERFIGEDQRNISGAVAVCFKEQPSIDSLKICLSYFVNLTSHPSPNPLALDSFPMFIETFAPAAVSAGEDVVISSLLCFSVQNYSLLFSSDANLLDRCNVCLDIVLSILPKIEDQSSLLSGLSALVILCKNFVTFSVSVPLDKQTEVQRIATSRLIYLKPDVQAAYRRALNDICTFSS